MEKRTIFFLLLLFVGTLALRLALVAQTGTFAPEGYFYFRQIEHMASEWEMLSTDALSYGGRPVIASPLFLLIMAVSYFFFPSVATLQIIPQVFVALLPVTVFLTVREMTRRSDAAFFSALMSAFIPVVFAETLFSLSPLTLSLPLSFLLVYFFLRSSAVPFIVCAIALALTHPSSIIPIFGFLFYLIIAQLASFRVERSELELILFSTFFTLWVHFLFYKKAFLLHGLSFIHQNIPVALLSRYFTEISLHIALLQVGVYPLLWGIASVSKYLFKTKDKLTFPILSLSIVVTLFLWLRFITPSAGFMYLGVCLSILAGPMYVEAASYFAKTRFSRFAPMAAVILFLLIIPSLALPSIYFAGQQKAVIVSPALADGLLWIRSNSSPHEVVLAVPSEGFVVASIAERKSVMDTNFLLAPNADERLADVERMFTTSFPTEAVALFNKYDVDYILVSPAAQRRFDVDKNLYSIPCLEEVYNERNVVVYQSHCRLSVTTSVI